MLRRRATAILVRHRVGDDKTSTDHGELPYWATRIAGRYMGTDVAEQYGGRNAVPPEMVVRVTTTSVVAKVDIADWSASRHVSRVTLAVGALPTPVLGGQIAGSVRCSPGSRGRSVCAAVNNLCGSRISAWTRSGS